MTIKVFTDRLKLSVLMMLVAINVLFTREEVVRVVKQGILWLREYVHGEAIEANDVEYKSPKPRTESIRDFANERSRRCASPFKFAVVLRHRKGHVGWDGFDVEGLQESSEFSYMEMLRLAKSLDPRAFEVFVIIALGTTTTRTAHGARVTYDNFSRS